VISIGVGTQLSLRKLNLLPTLPKPPNPLHQHIDALLVQLLPKRRHHPAPGLDRRLQLRVSPLCLKRSIREVRHLCSRRALFPRPATITTVAVGAAHREQGVGCAIRATFFGRSRRRCARRIILLRLNVITRLPFARSLGPRFAGSKAKARRS
jgi:hypothetical protein